MKWPQLFGHPNNWRPFYMKLTREQKIEIYEKRYKAGRTIPSLSNEYGIKKSNIAYLISLIDRHGTDILRKNENRYYSPELKLEIINKVLIQNQPVWATALEYGLSSDGMLHLWINRYKADGYVIIERKRGRSPTMIKEKQTKSLEDMTPEEKNKYYEERLLYLEAENEYLKKLHAVVQARKNRQQKKK